MRILLIGGNGFIGRFVVAALKRQGHAVAVFHRGSASAPDGVEEILGNRNQLSASAQELRRFPPGVVIDLVISSGRQAEELMNIFRGATQRVVMLSSIDVYRAVGVLHGTESGPLQEVPLTEESELRRNPHPYPRAGVERLRKIFPWVTDDYDKIPAECAVMNDRDLPGTVLRLPMVYGPGDPLRRFYPIVKRVDDGRRYIIFPETLAAWRSPRGYASDDLRTALSVLPSSTRIISLNPHRLSDIWNDILSVGEAAGRQAEAESLVGQSNQRVHRVRQVGAGINQPPRVLCLEWLDPPFIAGHWVPEMVQIAGGIDVMGRAGEPGFRTTWEEIFKAAPDMIFVMPCGYNLERTAAELRDVGLPAGWNRLPAVRTGRVIAVNASSYFSRPGPRVVIGLEMLAHALHPARMSVDLPSGAMMNVDKYAPAA